MGRIGFYIAGAVLCVFGLWVMYLFALGNTDDQQIDLPGYVKAFFLMVGFMIFGVGTALWKVGKKR